MIFVFTKRMCIQFKVYHINDYSMYYYKLINVEKQIFNQDFALINNSWLFSINITEFLYS